jgi:hypothetical protein
MVEILLYSFDIDLRNNLTQIPLGYTILFHKIKEECYNRISNVNSFIGKTNTLFSLVWTHLNLQQKPKNKKLFQISSSKKQNMTFG